MRPVSDAFLAAVRDSHVIAARVELTFPDGEAAEVAVEGGSLVIDRTAQTRRTGSIAIPWSLEIADELGLDIRTLPLGGWAKLRAGFRRVDGSEDLALLAGRMRVESVTWGTLDQSARIELADPMAQVRDQAFTAPYAAGGKRPAIAAREIVYDVFGETITYRILFDPPTVVQDVFFSGARDQAIADLARSVGAEAYFDADGAFVFDVAAGGGQVDTSGHLTDESTVVTAIPSTVGIFVGMTVTGIGIPRGRRVVSIDSATQVTLNARANIIGAKNSRTTTGSPVLTEITDTDDLSPGMSVTGSGIPAVTKIASVQVSTVTLDKPATADGYPLISFSAPADAALLFAGGSGAYPVFTVDAGEAGVMVAADESLDRSGVFNGVFITGQETAVTPVFSVLVVDDDDDSPTYWGGPFGRIAKVETLNSIQSPEQATYAAETMLNDALGLSRSLTIRAAPNPAIEAGDPIQVVFPDGRDERHIVDVARIDLSTGPLDLSTRSIYRPASAEAMSLAPLHHWARAPLHEAAAWAELRKAQVVA